MATYYHRDNPGAPALTYGAGLGWPALKNILKACLVYGYGSKPAAGWELVAEDTSYLVLRPGSQSGYVCFTNVGDAIRVYLAETYEGVSGGVITGVGVKSGVAAASSVPQAFSRQFLVYHSASTTWYMVADDRTFMLCMACPGSATPTDLASSNAGGGVQLYVGEDSEGNFISIGGNATTLTTNVGALYVSNFSMKAGATVLKDPATGLLVGSSAISVSTPSLHAATADSGGLDLSNNAAAFPELVTAPIEWLGNGVYVGRLRGLAIAANMLLMYRGGVAAALGRSTAFNTRNCSIPFDLGDGAEWGIVTGFDKINPTILMTTNEDYW